MSNLKRLINEAKTAERTFKQIQDLQPIVPEDITKKNLPQKETTPSHLSDRVKSSEQNLQIDYEEGSKYPDLFDVREVQSAKNSTSGPIRYSKMSEEDAATMYESRKKELLTNLLKKGGKKKVSDPFTRKEWYDIKAPAIFQNRNVGKTVVNRTAGQKIASDSLKGRIFEVSLADLQKDEELAFRKMRLRVEDVQGRYLLTNFHGMDFTSDKLKSLVRKWQTLIEANVDVSTTDGYKLRVFCIAFTKKRQNSLRKTAYAQHSQIKAIRKKMFDIITRECTSSDLKDLVQKFIPEAMGKSIERECHGIYPLQNVFIRKVKVLKTPKIDAGKIMEIHGEAAAAAPGEGESKDTADAPTGEEAKPAQ